ncbi:MAG: hypothetical protein ACK417_12285 [Bacteroidia bacterium]
MQRHQLGIEWGRQGANWWPIGGQPSALQVGPTYLYGLQYAFIANRWLQLEASVLVGDQFSLVDEEYFFMGGYQQLDLLAIPIKLRIHYWQNNRFQASGFVMMQNDFYKRINHINMYGFGSGFSFRYQDLMLKVDALVLHQLTALRAASYLQPGLRFGVNYAF